MKSSIFGDITLWSSLKVNLGSGGTCRLHLHGRRISQAKKGGGGLLPASSWFLACLIRLSWRWKRHVSPKHMLNFNGLHSVIWRLVSPFGVATGYGLDGRGVGVRVPVGPRLFSSPRRPDRFWGPPSLLSNGYQGLFPRAWSWPLTSN
jgi:hypothetical protein